MKTPHQKTGIRSDLVNKSSQVRSNRWWTQKRGVHGGGEAYFNTNGHSLPAQKCAGSPTNAQYRTGREKKDPEDYLNRYARALLNWHVGGCQSNGLTFFWRAPLLRLAHHVPTPPEHDQSSAYTRDRSKETCTAEGQGMVWKCCGPGDQLLRVCNLLIQYGSGLLSTLSIHRRGETRADTIRSLASEFSGNTLLNTQASPLT
jgi:hypothetical protein